jgi:hypothetical protein
MHLQLSRVGRFRASMLVCALLVLLLAGLFSQGAGAYLLVGCKWPGYTIYWYTDTSGDYATQASNSASAWSATSTRIAMSYSTINQVDHRSRGQQRE